jgi:hypothetical protein
MTTSRDLIASLEGKVETLELLEQAKRLLGVR